jgi:ParB-like chromosome segregation protein Spo0J
MPKTPITEFPEIKRIYLHSIAYPVPDRVRALQEDKVQALAASIAENGLLHPITVRPRKEGGYWLVAGVHRKRAVEQLGWKQIPAFVHKGMNDDNAILAEIDENLQRADLSPGELASCIAKRKEVYERLHPETKHGGDRKSKSSRQLGDLNKRFTEDTAKKTGRSERKIQRDATRGEKVKVLHKIKGTSLDKGEELDALAKLDPADQEKLAEAAQRGEKVSARKPRPSKAAPGTFYDEVTLWDSWSLIQRKHLAVERGAEMRAALDAAQDEAAFAETNNQSDLADRGERTEMENQDLAR